MLVYTAFWICAHEGFHVFTTLQVCKVVVIIEGKVRSLSFYLINAFLHVNVTVNFSQF